MKQNCTLPSPLEGSKSNPTSVADGLGQTLLSQRGLWNYAQVSCLIPATAGQGLAQLFACLRACGIERVLVPLLIPCKIHKHSAAGLGRRELTAALQAGRPTTHITLMQGGRVHPPAFPSPAPGCHSSTHIQTHGQLSVLSLSSARFGWLHSLDYQIG